MILRIRILDLLLYWGLGDLAWKMTKLETDNSGQMTTTFEPKKRRHLACANCGTVAKHQRLGMCPHQALHQISNTGLAS